MQQRRGLYRNGIMGISIQAMPALQQGCGEMKVKVWLKNSDEPVTAVENYAQTFQRCLDTCIVNSFPFMEISDDVFIAIDAIEMYAIERLEVVPHE